MTKKTILTFFLLLPGFLHFVMAQTNPITLNVKKGTYAYVFKSIEAQCNYTFLVNESELNTKDTLSVVVQNKALNHVLSEILQPNGLVYTIEGSHIVIKKKSRQNATSAKSIKGIVKDEAGEPLIGVTVVIKGTTMATVTDVDGEYTLVANSSNILAFSYIGYLSQEIVVENKHQIDVILKENMKTLNEVVVVGYGTVKKSDATGALDVIKNTDFNKGAISSAETLLSGHVAGVQILHGSGQPGANANVRIRGVNSISASSEPLYVIDGVPIDNTRRASNVGHDAALSDMSLNPLSMIAPADIESMTVLKDASATAIYGSRGANGVIIITTKSGKDGVKSLNYSSSLGISRTSKKINVLTADEFRKYVPTADKNVSTDWQDEIFRTVLTQEHNITFSSGNKSTSYRASLNMSDQPGIVLSSGLKRYSLRLNLMHKMFDDRLILNVNANNTRYEFQNMLEQQTSGADGGIINNALKGDPTQPVFKPDGSFNEYMDISFRNPVAIGKQISDKTVGDRLIANADAEFFFIPKELSLKVSLGYDVDNSDRKAYQPIASIISSRVQGRAVLDNNRYSSFLTETYASYNKTFGGRHALNIIGGYSWQEFESYYVRNRGEGFVSDALGANNIQGAKSIITTNNKEVNRLVSYYGRVTYGLGDKYIFTATVRRDGSSRFGSNNVWGVFPSGAFAWKIKEERFMKDVTVVSDLKLRLGYGITGNQDIGNFRYQQIIEPNGQYGTMWDQNLIPSYHIRGIANPDLKWEQTAQFNIGVDYAFLRNRIRGSVDVYSKKTSDLLLEVDAVQPAVYNKYLDNIGEMTNKGVEFTINASIIESKDFGWSTNFNIAYNKNEITKLNNDRDIYYGNISGKGGGGNPLILRVGQPFGTFYGRKFIGVEQTGVDKDGNPISVEKFEEGPNQILGHALPDLTLGLTNTFNYKNFDLSVMLRSALGGKVFNNTRAELQNGRLPNLNTNREGAEDYLKGLGGITYTSSRWLEDASFLRLDNMTVGYNFNILPQVIKSARISFTAQNLFVITKYSGYDPEVNNQSVSGGINSTGMDYCSYPHARTFLFSLNLNF